MRHRRIKSVIVVLAGLLLAALGVGNLITKASWSVMDDGVFWTSTPRGLVAAPPRRGPALPPAPGR